MPNQPVKRLQLCPYDREWLETFEAERERLTAALGSRLLHIEHVGSTSVPGLLAKPVVDIALAVASATEADFCIEPLQALGYEYRGLHGDDVRRRYYVLERGGRRVAQVHLYIVPAAGWDQKLRFREVLRVNAAVREAYAREKLRIAEMVDWDKAAYSLAKGPFIESILDHYDNAEVELMSVKETQFDQTKAEAFAGKVLTALNNGALCLMVSIAHRTGLFDSMSQSPPASSEEIANRAGLNERYVREWLGAMVTGGVLDFDPATNCYSLPAEHAAFLTRAAAADNMAGFAQYIAVMGCVEDDIIECFRKGGGVPYEKFPRFHEVMAEDSGQSVLSSLESHILPLAPGLMDQLANGIRVLDAGCGRGRILTRLAELYPRSRFVGMDLSREATDYAQDHAAKAGLKNVEFIAADLSAFDMTAEPEAFDFVTTFDAIHDQAKPLNVLRGIHRTLKTDGVYLMQDISGSSHVHKNIEHPLGTFLYTISCMHCMTVSLAQGGEGLGAMWGEEKTREYLQQAGFRSITTHRLAHDIQNNWYVVTK